MKKILLTMVFLLTALLIAGCELGQRPPAEPVGEPPVFYGIMNAEIYAGSFFDPLEGIIAIDPEDGDITTSVTMTGLEALGLDAGIVTNTGVFDITYTVEDSDGFRVSSTRTVTVIEADDMVDQWVASHLLGCGNYFHGDYVISWCDEFNSSGDNLNDNDINLDHWRFQTGTGTQYGLTAWGNNERQFYREQNVRVDNNRLIIEAILENYGGMPYTSARLWTRATFAQRYGRFEASIRLPVGTGLWPAFWMMPETNTYGGWAASGEIDIMEARGRQPDRSIGALHFGGSWPANTHTAQTYHFPSGQHIGQFNQYAVEWEEGVIRWYVNGNLFKTSTNWYTLNADFPAPFDQPFYLLLNLAVGGTFDNNLTPPDDLFDQPVLMEIAYVRVYTMMSS